MEELSLRGLVNEVRTFSSRVGAFPSGEARTVFCRYRR